MYTASDEELRVAQAINNESLLMWTIDGPACSSTWVSWRAACSQPLVFSCAIRCPLSGLKLTSSAWHPSDTLSAGAGSGSDQPPLSRCRTLYAHSTTSGVPLLRITHKLPAEGVASSSHAVISNFPDDSSSQQCANKREFGTRSIYCAAGIMVFHGESQAKLATHIGTLCLLLA